MALPHQVGLLITYDGTVEEKASGSAASSGSSEIRSTPTPGYGYKVQPGDCLWNLAKDAYGSGAKYTIIYEANKNIIEQEAKAHGFSSSDNGSRIWPDTVLAITEIESTAKKTETKKVSSGVANPELGKKIAKQATAFSYTDVASGSSDSVSITMYDIAKEWLSTYMPKKGASLGAKMKLTNWNNEEKNEKFNCGTFVLDDISFSGRPISCVLGGVSVPANDDFKTLKRTKTWEDTTIKEIASEIAKRAGVSLHYDAGTIRIAEVEQSKQTDSAFLYSLCEKYGLAMKAYNKKIVIFDIVKYEKKAAVLTLAEKDLLSWSYQTSIDGTYTGVSLNYTDPDSDETISVTIGSAGRMYEMDSQASSRYDAELQASAKANAANREIEKMTVTIRANIQIVASHCIGIKGLGAADGKYYIDKIQHTVGNSGYTMKLTMHKVQTPVGEQAAESSSGSKSKSTPTPGYNYTVKSGDCLWNLADAAYGTGTKYTKIYNANKDTIEAKAKARGLASSENGAWIFEGTVLYIPEV